MKLPLTDKAETRKALFHSLGCDADDWLEGAKRQAAGFEGAKQALVQSMKNVQALSAMVDQDVENGKLDKLEPLEIAAYAKLFVSRAVDSLANQARNMGNAHQSTLGEIAAYDKVVKHFQKLHEGEEQKIKQVEEAVASGEITVGEDGTAEVGEDARRRIPGVRPAQGIAAQRRAEDAAEETPEPASKPKKKAPPTCGYCKEKGHTSRGCPKKKADKES